MVHGIFRINCVNSLVKPTSFSRTFHRTTPAMIKVGEALPPGELAEGNPSNRVNLKEICKGKKVVLFAVPGAFTPGCSKTHLPGYLNQYKSLKNKGIDEIICLSVNDAFVMDAWSKSQHADGKIRMLADADASYTKALNLHMDVPQLGGVRSRRYSMILEDGIVKQINVEPDGLGLTCSLVEKLNV